MSEKKPCRGCGIPIEFIRNEATGKMIPAQMVRSVYVVVEDLAGERALRKMTPDGFEGGYVSHFETCPVADRFSKGKCGD